MTKSTTTESLAALQSSAADLNLIIPEDESDDELSDEEAEILANMLRRMTEWTLRRKEEERADHRERMEMLKQINEAARELLTPVEQGGMGPITQTAMASNSPVPLFGSSSLIMSVVGPTTHGKPDPDDAQVDNTNQVIASVEGDDVDDAGEVDEAVVADDDSSEIQTVPDLQVSDDADRPVAEASDATQMLLQPMENGIEVSDSVVSVMKSSYVKIETETGRDAVIESGSEIKVSDATENSDFIQPDPFRVSTEVIATPWKPNRAVVSVGVIEMKLRGTVMVTRPPAKPPNEWKFGVPGKAIPLAFCVLLERLQGLGKNMFPLRVEALSGGSNTFWYKVSQLAHGGCSVQLSLDGRIDELRIQTGEYSFISNVNLIISSRDLIEETVLELGCTPESRAEVPPGVNSFIFPFIVYFEVVRPPAKPPDIFTVIYLALNGMVIILGFKNLFGHEVGSSMVVHFPIHMNFLILSKPEFHVFLLDIDEVVFKSLFGQLRALFEKLDGYLGASTWLSCLGDLLCAGTEINSIVICQKEIIAIRSAKKRNMGQLVLVLGGVAVNPVIDLSEEILVCTVLGYALVLWKEKYPLVEEDGSPLIDREAGILKFLIGQTIGGLFHLHSGMPREKLAETANVMREYDKQRGLPLQLLYEFKHELKFLQGTQVFPDKLYTQSVACFFRDTVELDKNIVGDFLVNHGAFCVQVLKELAITFDFQDMRLDTTLRLFLETFRCPRGSKNIQKMKKKRTEEDFLHNNRHVHGVVVLGMNLKSWIDLENKSTITSSFIVANNEALADNVMFAIMFGPTIAAISLVFGLAAYEDVFQRCLNGLLATTKISMTISACHHLEVILDVLVGFPTLSNPISGNELVRAFGGDTEARMPTVMVFTITNRYDGDGYIRQYIYHAKNSHSAAHQSKFWQANSLLQHAEARLGINERSQKGTKSSEGEDASVFYLGLLIAITLNKQDKTGLLIISQRLLPYNEKVADELLKSLLLALLLDVQVADAYCVQITKEVGHIVKTHAAHNKHFRGWQTIRVMLFWFSEPRPPEAKSMFLNPEWLNSCLNGSGDLFMFLWFSQPRPSEDSSWGSFNDIASLPLNFNLEDKVVFEGVGVDMNHIDGLGWEDQGAGLGRVTKTRREPELLRDYVR